MGSGGPGGGGGGAGDTSGAASSTDKALVRFSGTTGKVLQNGSIVEDDSGNLTVVGTVNNMKISAAHNVTLQQNNGGL